LFESGRDGRLLLLAIVRHLQLRRRHVADRLEQPAMIEPVDPFERRVFDRIEVPPGAAVTDDLGLEQTDDRLGQALSYESPTLPTEGSTPASASRSV
jgi:hypothetical protein